MALPHESDSGYGPGVHVRGDELHIDVGELLREKGLTVTPESLERTARLIEKAAAELGLPAKTVTCGPTDVELDVSIAELDALIEERRNR